MSDIKLYYRGSGSDLATDVSAVLTPDERKRFLIKFIDINDIPDPVRSWVEGIIQERNDLRNG